TGEQISSQTRNIVNPARGYWSDAYTTIRYINHFIKELPIQGKELSSSEIDEYLGEACFLRAYTYFALVKRYGGVPIIKEVQSFPEQDLEELQVPRNTEYGLYDFIAEDLDVAISKLPEISPSRGRANKYIAAAFKSRVMLFAGSIAKYGQQNDAVPAVGIPSSRANEYFKLSYDASIMLEGKYTLYRSNPDKYKNYVDLFLDKNSPENIFVKDYSFPATGHAWDHFNVPYQYVGPRGGSRTSNPTVDFIELFDGIPRDSKGHIKTKDENDNCIFYENRYEIFKDAEPRLRGSVIFAGDIFKGEEFDLRRGTYIGPIDDGIKYTDDLTINPFTNTAVARTASGATNNPLIDIGGGVMQPASGPSGPWTSASVGTGFSIRKYMDENKPASMVRPPNYSTQSWIDIRYAEVLLNRAEAAFELYESGYTEGGINFLNDAFLCINDIRERAGAVLLVSETELNDIEIIRKERWKELAFENKIWWDIRRWRTADKDLNNRSFFVLNAWYVLENGKYIFQRRPDERNARYTFNVNWYYEPIPASEIAKNPNLLPNNPGY
ncbi:MAG: RagB/SusD family nutrient uptake outer membrane protein, partial [bacterium]